MPKDAQDALTAFMRLRNAFLPANARAAAQPCNLYYRPGFIAHRIPFLMIP
jgi:hypothetical protein